MIQQRLSTAAKPLGRREQNKQEKLRRIIMAARHLFHANGFEATTTQEVAERAEVAAGTLFLYASTKEDLLILAFVDEMIEVSQRAFDQVDSQAAFADQIVDFFCSILAYHSADVRLARALLREVSVLRNPEMLADIDRLPIIDLAAAIARAAQARGEARGDLDAGEIAYLMFAVYWDSLKLWINGALDDAAFRARLRSMVAVVMAGVEPRRDAPRAVRPRPRHAAVAIRGRRY